MTEKECEAIISEFRHAAENLLTAYERLKNAAEIIDQNTRLPERLRSVANMRDAARNLAAQASTARYTFEELVTLF